MIEFDSKFEGKNRFFIMNPQKSDMVKSLSLRPDDSRGLIFILNFSKLQSIYGILFKNYGESQSRSAKLNQI